MYYIDNSENPSSKPEDAIEGPHVNLEYAQQRAIELAKKSPGTEYYVNATVTTVVQVYRTCAHLTVESEIVEPTDPS